MNSIQRQLIVETFDVLRGLEVRAGERFYKNLFAHTPALARMFGRVAMPEQGGKLIQVLAYVVDGLERWDAVTAQVEELGARHVRFGVRADHYAAVGSALVSTLREILGAGFTEEAEEAWQELYTEISLVMERGARSSSEPLPATHNRVSRSPSQQRKGTL